MLAAQSKTLQHRRLLALQHKTGVIEPENQQTSGTKPELHLAIIHDCMAPAHLRHQIASGGASHGWCILTPFRSIIWAAGQHLQAQHITTC